MFILYLLSTHEIWEDVDENESSGIDYNDTVYNNTRQLDYYKNNDVTTSSYSLEIKKYNNSDSIWWLRSGASYSSNHFYAVASTGNWYTNGSYNSYGVSPAFRLG